jgi:hypothetical protein
MIDLKSIQKSNIPNPPLAKPESNLKMTYNAVTKELMKFDKTTPNSPNQKPKKTQNQTWPSHPFAIFNLVLPICYLGFKNYQKRKKNEFTNLFGENLVQA